MAWEDLTPQEKREIKADAWVMALALCAALGGAAWWYYCERMV